MSKKRVLAIIAAAFLVLAFVGCVNSGNMGTSAGTGNGTTTSKSGIDATKKYRQGEFVTGLSGKVTKMTKDNYWVAGDDGIEYKCFPDNKDDMQYFAVGSKINFAGTVLSTSRMSVNLERALWLDTEVSR